MGWLLQFIILAVVHFFFRYVLLNIIVALFKQDLENVRIRNHRRRMVELKKEEQLALLF